MRRRLFVTWIVALAAAGTVPAGRATAEPGAVVMDLRVEIGCLGCGVYGPSGNSLTGTVVVGDGALPTGTEIDGTFTVTEPTGTACLTSGTASGTLTTENGFTAPFVWERAGGLAAVTVAGYATGTGALTLDGGPANPCGTAVTGSLRVALTRTFDPFAIAGQRAPWGEISIRTVVGGFEMFPGGMFAESSRFRCDWVSAPGELVVACEPRTGQPSWQCGRMEAVSRVYPSRSGFVVNPQQWGALTTTTSCRGVWTTSTTTPDASMNAPTTTASGQGPGSTTRFECRARRSSWGAASPPRSPFNATCRTYAA